MMAEMWIPEEWHAALKCARQSIQWALRVSATICFVMVVMVFFGVRGNGAGSTRDTVQRALNRVHPHAA